MEIRDGLVIWTEEDFLDLPEDERPYKRPWGGYLSKGEERELVWLGGARFHDDHGRKWASSMGPEDRSEEKLRLAVQEGRYSDKPCNICHVPYYKTHWMKGKHLDLILERGICFHCAFYEDKVANPSPVIIDGSFYSPGNRRSGTFRGMGGRRFDIEFIDGPHKGKRITTFDLWSGGTMPQHWKEKLKDNAIFLGGAAKVELPYRETARAWNPSDELAPEYSAPHTLGLGVRQP